MILNQNRLSLFKIVQLIVAFILLSGCYHPKIHKMQINLLIPDREAEKIHLRVGLYLDPQFTNCIVVPPWGTNFYRRIEMGEALSKGSEYILNRSFKEVVTIYTMDAKLIPKGLDALVIPEIDRIYENAQDPFKKHSAVTAKIKWTIIDMNKKVLYKNTFIGEAKYKFWPLAAHPEEIPAGYTRAVEDQFRKAYIGITTTKWWESLKKETH